jgi:hypothetical protein
VGFDAQLRIKAHAKMRVPEKTNLLKRSVPTDIFSKSIAGESGRSSIPEP